MRGLKVCAENRINLAKLESRPIHGESWKCLFYADIEADLQDGTLAMVLSAIQEKTEYLRVLGCY